ncbi:aminotransferase class I/II-fold pyridoxal phosphate-dependent enzyme [Planctobacterium marinum]|uniref:aminotransferase class I/II-fold pyridoxal phosphate-dependent enzyme n=1 Tax=Planctobacterium marinum TaxID=1631968 RepID=UPI002B4C1C8E|nr:aminotransferase class I/II-fold pyridoxal phosphate-dependent enzyme [Planctobacterium marinum]
MMSNYTVYIGLYIKDALEVINRNSKGAVAVVESDGTLIQLLTDGDIRRLILEGYALDTKLSGIVMKRQTITVEIGTEAHTAKMLLDEQEIDHLVYVNKDKSVAEIKHRRDLDPILLSSPHMGKDELRFIEEAFNTNWIAPLGPNVNEFEKQVCEITGAKHAVAVSSGTAAIHLALLNLNVQQGDYVLCSSLTFVASCNPILYQQATPVFVDSEPNTWNMCPKALLKAMQHIQDMGVKPKAIIVVNLYGQSSDMDSLIEISEQFNVPIIEDAAESLGAKYKGKHSGTFGKLGVFSFNGNKIITTSGGGMLISDSKEMIEQSLHRATQARNNAPYYLHSEVGFNYRMSNILAGIGRGQLNVLEERVKRRREIYNRYVEGLSSITELEFMPELEGYYSNRWLTAATLNPNKTEKKVTELLQHLAKQNIEARHVWKPMHTQPLFKDVIYFTATEHSVSDYLFENGLCLPSGSNLTDTAQDRVIQEIKRFFE